MNIYVLVVSSWFLVSGIATGAAFTDLIIRYRKQVRRGNR